MATVMTSKGPPLPARPGPPRRGSSLDNPNPMKNVPLPPVPGETGTRIPSTSNRPLPPPPGQESKHTTNIGRSASAGDQSNSVTSRDRFVRNTAAIQNTSPRSSPHAPGIHHSHSAPEVPPSHHRSPPPISATHSQTFSEQGPPVPKRTASRHGSTSDQFTARTMVPDYTNSSQAKSAQSLPPSRSQAHSHSSQSSSSTHHPAPFTDRPPPPPASRPPLKSQRSASLDLPDDNDIERRFRFHDLSDFPEPESFSRCKKTYPSTLVEQKTDKNQSTQPYLGAL